MLPVLLASLIAAPNVVVISVDTLRADHLGFYGHRFETSPTLDKFAERALVFDDMICEIPLTGPSMVSMMTSRFPRSTGVIRNGVPLAEDTPTVAQSFSAAGYATFCVTSNWTLKRKLAALHKGFDTYDDEFTDRRWGVMKGERDAADVTALALQALANRDQDKPFFAWVHYSDPHAPYQMRHEFRVSKKVDWPGDRGARHKVRYDSEIAYTDAWIAKFLEAVPTENTYIVFLSDHGESLEEHGYVGHGRRLYQPGLKIPFMIAGPGIEPGRTDRPARGVDVGPTLLGLAGLETLPMPHGLDLLNDPVPAERVRIIETYGGAVPNIPGVKEIMLERGPDLQGALAAGWKLVLDGNKAELFHLADDPDELSNRAKTESDRVAELRAHIEAWSALIESAVSGDAGLNEEDAEALRSLGYID